MNDHDDLLRRLQIYIAGMAPHHRDRMGGKLILESEAMLKKLRDALPEGEPVRHATVIKDGFRVPLIGVPESAVLEECDLCHDTFPMTEVAFTGTQTLCKKCAG